MLPISFLAIAKLRLSLDIDHPIALLKAISVNMGINVPIGLALGLATVMLHRARVGAFIGR